MTAIMPPSYDILALYLVFTLARPISIHINTPAAYSTHLIILHEYIDRKRAESIQ